MYRVESTEIHSVEPNFTMMCLNVSVWTVAPTDWLASLFPETTSWLCGWRCKCLFSLQDPTCFLFLCQLKIQIQQQSQEISVGVDGSFLDQLLQSLFEWEMMVDHEVCQNQGRWPAHSHDAVHQNFPWRTGKMKGGCEERISEKPQTY